MYRRFFLLGAGAALAGCATATTTTTETATRRVAIPPGTRLIILRHGDRDGEQLNDKGRERARALVPALANEPVQAIFSPGIDRNLDTAAPLAEARGLEIRRIPVENPAARLMQQGAGQTIVWVGNKGNLNSIWEALGAPGDPPLEYGDLFIVERGALGRPKVTRRRFGPV